MNRLGLVGRRLALVPLAALVLIAVAPEADSAAAMPITSCGQVVTTNAFLPGDLICADSDGVVAGASGITIDLKGFMVLGDHTEFSSGVDVSGFDRVTIKNGVVRGFDFGLFSSGNKVVIDNVVASSNGRAGILINADLATVKSSTASRNSRTGILIGGDGAKIQSSTASGNGFDGIAVGGANTTVQSSAASGNGDQGIWLEGDGAKLKGNRAEANDSHGIWVIGDQPEVKGNRVEANGFGGTPFDGTGILITGYTTNVRASKNIARGNDNPNECDPTNLC